MRTRLPLFTLLLPCAMLPCRLPAQEPDALPDFATLERDYTEARSDWNMRLREASRAGDKEALTAIRADRPEAAFLPRFLAGAEARTGTDAAVPFLAWLVSRGRTEMARNAMETLMEDHVAHPGITRAVARLGGLHQRFGKEKTRAWLDLVLERNEDPAVQAQARFTRSAMHVGTRAVTRSEDLRRLAIADLNWVLEKAESPSLQGLATGLLFEAENLEPGLVAPDIEGEDLDGVAFKLSDYRGKVVLLDFWGDW